MSELSRREIDELLQRSRDRDEAIRRDLQGTRENVLERLRQAEEDLARLQRSQ
jgi:hypothetical protein